jgi:hypothetical protein
MLNKSDRVENKVSDRKFNPSVVGVLCRCNAAATMPDRRPATGVTANHAVPRRARSSAQALATLRRCREQDDRSAAGWRAPARPRDPVRTALHHLRRPPPQVLEDAQMTCGSSISAITRIGPLHLGHASRSASYTLQMRCADTAVCRVRVPRVSALGR